MKKKWIAIAAVAIILLAFSIPLIIRGCNNSDNASGTGQSHAVAVVRADLRTTVSAFGRISMPHQARLTFDIGGGASNVVQMNAEFGDAVKKGDVLAKLDTTPFDRAVDVADNDLHLAKLALDAATIPDDKDAKRTLFDNAYIALQEAWSRLDGAVIEAPFDGVITEVGVVVGDSVTTATPIFLLVDINQSEAIAMIDEVDVNKVAAGQTATITLDAIPGAVVNGTVKAISPQATVALGVVTYKASVDISPASGIQLRDGMTARIDIVVANKINVLVVPNAAITRKGSNRIVEVELAGGKTEERVVTIGTSNATYTEILSGLKAGESVMVPGK
jgi:macrolide-specific efflux system membrane fusion protein